MTEHTSASTTSSDLRDIVGPVWRRKWLVLAIVVLGTVATYLASAQREKSYRAVTQVFVSDSQVQTLLNSASALAGTDRDTQDQAQILLSRPVAQGVIDRLALKETPGALLRTVQATPSARSNFVTVAAERPSPQNAAAVANAFAKEYIDFRGQQLARDLDSAIRGVTTQLDRLPKAQSAKQQRDDLRSTLGTLQAARAVAPSQARQTDSATAPNHAFTPRPKRDAAFGLVISIALALALAFTLERFDRRIKRFELIPEIYGAPLLSVVPHASSTTAVEDGKAVIPDILREPFRSLRTNLQLASIDRPLSRLIVTSAVPGEGKSTIVRNLALVYREWGMNVVVVEADLRRPALSQLFGMEPPAVGLTSVVIGDAELEDALLEIEVDIAGLEYLDKVRSRSAVGPAAGPTSDSSTTETRMALLPSGPAPPNPQAVLATDRVHQLLDKLAERFDVVLVDTPPLLAVSDAVPLMSQADGVIIVSRIGLTERSAAERVMEACRSVPDAKILGVVANDLPSEPGAGYGYGYQYGYGNGAKAKS